MEDSNLLSQNSMSTARCQRQNSQVSAPISRQNSMVAREELAAAMTASGLSVRVDEEQRERSADGWEYSSYTIVTSYQGQSFASQRRFREFRALHKQLLPHVSSLAANFPLWAHLLNRYAPEVIEMRKVGLARYLTDVLAALQGAVIPQVLRIFLQLPLPDESREDEDRAAAMMVHAPTMRP